MHLSEIIVLLPLLVTMPVGVALLTYVFKRRAGVDFPLSILILTGLIWSLGYVIELIVSDRDVMLRAVQFQYIAFVSGSVAWLLLALEMHGRLQQLVLWQYLALLLIPTVTVALALTSEYHTWLWQTQQVLEYGSLTSLDFTYGPGFWVHIIYSYSLNIIAAGMIVRAIIDSRRYYFRQQLAIVIALTLPWLANAIYVFRVSSYPLDGTPIAIAVSSIMLVFVVFRYGLGDLVPIARQRVISEMHDALLVIDNRRRIIDFNKAAVELLGSTSVGASADEVLVDHPKLLTLLERQLENTDVIYTGFGDTVHRISSELLRFDGDDTSAKLLLIRDISRDSKIEDALRVVLEGTSEYLGEDFFRSLARSLALALRTDVAMVAELDQQDMSIAQTLAFWDIGVFESNFSYPLQGSPGGNVVAASTCHYASRVASKFPGDVALATKNIDAYLGTPLLDHTGTPIGILAVMHREPFSFGDEGQSLIEIFAMRAATEIERRRNERRIFESEQSYRRIVETTRDAVCVVDGRGEIEFANERFAKLLALDVDSIKGELLVQHVETQGVPVSSLISLADQDLDFELKNSRGDEAWVSVSKTVIEAGDDGSMLLVFSDKTEQHRLSELNRGIEEQLQHAQKLESLGVLAGGVAHDFNNLLMPILGYLELIRQKSTSSEVLDYLEKIESAGEKLSDLCNQMLTYSGKGHFTQTVVDVNAVVSDIRDLARATVSHHITLGYDLKENISPIRADVTQLNQVLMNLLINASEAMADTTDGRIRITTGEKDLSGEVEDGLHVGDVFEPGRFAYFKVIDEGVGIDRADLARLFEPFYTTKFTGRGLGMAVVYGIVRAHHGAIHIRSALHQGTTVTVYFPTEKSPTEKDAAHGTRPAALAGGDRRVLVVDDEPYVRDLFQGMLENLGYQVSMAENGRAGLELFKQDSAEISICILDLTMPGLGGTELLGHIRALDADVPVLLVSGYSQQELSDHSREFVNVGFLQKPFTMDQFRLALQALALQS